MHRLPLLCVIFLALSSFVEAEAPLPNVIVFMADDMGMGDTSAYQDVTGNSNDKQIATPGMERLAAMGMRFTDAHTPSSRCTATRYGLMTGRYPWRNRLKHFVLFGSQGDPMIEADRPTLATLFRDKGYATTMVGKWHIGLRYRQSDGEPAAGWDDADLTQKLYDTPLDHGFQICRFTSRSHGTSGIVGKKNGPNQDIGPGHIDGRTLLSPTGNRKELVEEGPQAYILTDLGRRHSDNAIQFLKNHVGGEDSGDNPFFLYYASNSNHSPYTPAEEIGGVPVRGEGKSKLGRAMGERYDFIYENDVALDRLITFLSDTDDPRNEGAKLIENTIVIFTSDNGAEIANKNATGPWRSYKGSGYEGGHRVPFLVSWKAGGIKPGTTSDELIALQDMFATFSEIVGTELPDWPKGEKGGEDSFSVLEAWRGGKAPSRPLFHNDHREGKDPAATGFRLDNPVVAGVEIPGKWKLFLDGDLVRFGKAEAVELFNLSTDSMESKNLADDPVARRLLPFLASEALRHRQSGGTRMTGVAKGTRQMLRWIDGVEGVDLRDTFSSSQMSDIIIPLEDGVTMTVAAERKGAAAEDAYSINPKGLGLNGGGFGQFDGGEALLVRFDRDVAIESVAIVAGNGSCGGFYRVGDRAPLAIYCVDADNDTKDQHGVIGDIGVLRKGEVLRLDTSPHLGVESPGQWRLQHLAFRPLEP